MRGWNDEDLLGYEDLPTRTDRARKLFVSDGLGRRVRRVLLRTVTSVLGATRTLRRQHRGAGRINNVSGDNMHGTRHKNRRRSC